MAIPKPFMYDHIKSGFHINNVQLMDISLERCKDYIKGDNYVTNSDESDDEFCDTCCTSYSYVHKLKHKTSEEHKKFVIYDKILSKICIIFKDVSNNLHVLDEIKEIFNEGEKPIRTVNYNEVISIINNNASNISHQTFANENTTDVKIKKDLAIIETNNMVTETKEYKDNKSEDYKESSETSFDINKRILIEKISETVNELTKTNLDQVAVEEKSIDMMYCDICDIQTTFRAFDGYLHGLTHRENSMKPKITEQKPNKKNNAQKTYCDVCNIFRRDIDIHYKSKKHKKRVYKIILTDHHFRTYIIDTLSDGVKYCKVCKVILDCNKVTEHVEVNDHLNKYKKILKDYNIIKVGHDYFCPACDLFEHDVVKHILEKHKTPILFPYETFCDVCRIKVPKSNLMLHLKGKLHVGNQQHKKKKQFEHICMFIDDIDSIKDVMTVENSTVKCKICKVLFYNVSQLKKHMNSDIHKNTVSQLYYDNDIQALSDGKYKCNICNAEIMNVLEHIYSINHKENLVWVGSKLKGN